MLLWLVLALMTVGAVLALSRPLVRRSPEGGAAAPVDEPALQIYRDQLDEIESDVARGVIGADEAKSARIEISRRLLGAAERLKSDRLPAQSAGSGRILQSAIVAGVPVMALGLYLVLGSPMLPDQPHAARAKASAANAEPQLDELVRRVEARLREYPGEGRGWDAIAPIYMQLERYDDAIRAFDRAVALLGETPRRLIGLGEARVLARNGLVTEEARKAFERVRALSPDAVEPRFWLAVAKEQDGDVAGALADLKQIMAGGPADAPWRAALQQRIEELEAKPAARTAAGSGQRGPTLEAAAAAAAARPQPDVEQSRMIEEMVSGLAKRLGSNGRDPEGWQRLVRSYVVLGRREDALKALTDGRKALSGDAASITALDALAASLGLGS